FQETHENLQVELFPSSGRGPGKGLYLPYRGAGLDGFGSNPLLDPNASYAPIHLRKAHARLERTLPEDLYRLASAFPAEEHQRPSAETPRLAAGQPNSD